MQGNTGRHGHRVQAGGRGWLLLLLQLLLRSLLLLRCELLRGVLLCCEINKLLLLHRKFHCELRLMSGKQELMLQLLRRPSGHKLLLLH